MGFYLRVGFTPSFYVMLSCYVKWRKAERVGGCFSGVLRFLSITTNSISVPSPSLYLLLTLLPIDSSVKG